MTKKKSPQFYTEYDQHIDSQAFVDSVQAHFGNVEDPRINANQSYPLTALLVIILGAILAGANSILAIYNYSRVKFPIFQRLFEIEQPPSYCVFWWLLVRLDPSQLEAAFFMWVRLLPDEVKERVIAIDGKRLNGSKQQLVHLVSAWDTGRGLLIGQVKAEQKSNEITAIPELLKAVDVKDAIVTIDAAGCQKKIVEDIVSRGGDYVIALKGNQGMLHAEAENFFSQAREIGHADMECLVETTVEKGHGRLETREVVVSQDLGWLEGQTDWAKLKTVIEVTATREIRGKISKEKRYYIASLDLTPEKGGNLVRGHWGIENHLHWSLDVVFKEDDCVVNVGHAPENLALFRRIAHFLIQTDVGGTKGVAEKRRQAGWDDTYMLHLLGVLVKQCKSFS
jgi:predicted transposase YbfD/YdcC